LSIEFPGHINDGTRSNLSVANHRIRFVIYQVTIPHLTKAFYLAAKQKMTRDSEKPMTIVFEPHGSLRDLTEYFDCVPHSYLKEIEALLKTKFAADVVHVFDYTVNTTRVP
jgi:hypothetical protein